MFAAAKKSSFAFTLAVAVALSFVSSSASATGQPELSSLSDTGGSRQWHIQYHYGLASDTDLIPSLVFQFDRSQERTFLHSLSIGKQIKDSIFGVSARVSAYLGFQYFGEKDLQSDVAGTTLYWKINKTIRLPYIGFPLRFGIGQGLSYVSRIPVSEVRDFEPKVSARLLNYLEFTLQFSISDLLEYRGSRMSASLQDVHIGYGIFHRSSVFGLFAEEGGGVNYPGIGIDFEFR